MTKVAFSETGRDTCTKEITPLVNTQLCHVSIHKGIRVKLLLARLLSFEIEKVKKHDWRLRLIFLEPIGKAGWIKKFFVKILPYTYYIYTYVTF